MGEISGNHLHRRATVKTCRDPERYRTEKRNVTTAAGTKKQPLAGARGEIKHSKLARDRCTPFYSSASDSMGLGRKM